MLTKLHDGLIHPVGLILGETSRSSRISEMLAGLGPNKSEVQVLQQRRSTIPNINNSKREAVLRQKKITLFSTGDKI